MVRLIVCNYSTVINTIYPVCLSLWLHHHGYKFLSRSVTFCISDWQKWKLGGEFPHKDSKWNEDSSNNFIWLVHFPPCPWKMLLQIEGWGLCADLVTLLAVSRPRLWPLCWLRARPPPPTAGRLAGSALAELSRHCPELSKTCPVLSPTPSPVSGPAALPQIVASQAQQQPQSGKRVTLVVVVVVSRIFSFTSLSLWPHNIAPSSTPPECEVELQVWKASVFPAGHSPVYSHPSEFLRAKLPFCLRRYFGLF